MKKYFTPTVQQWSTLVARLILGGVLLAAGWLKAISPSEAQSAVRVYQVLPTGLANGLGLVLPWLEIGMALLLIVGIWVRPAALAAGGLMLIFIIAIAQAWARKLPINCGCFGNGGITADGKVHPWVYATEIIRDIGLVLCAGFLLRFPHGKLGLDARE
jgi:uncharacterized membrane protein YphA (DoxX/SURF4 family)